jgi:hypothetical protein
LAVPAIRIRTTLQSDTLTLPELRPLIGKAVEIRVVERRPARTKRRPAEPVPTLDEVRAALAKIPGSMTADFVAERGER